MALHRTLLLAATAVATAATLSATPAAAAIATEAAATAVDEATTTTTLRRVLANTATQATKSSFQWVDDPHATDPCTEPGCVNHTKYGSNVVPRTISTDATIVFQEAERPAGLSAVLLLETYTQPGCSISGCRMTKTLGIFPKEDCFNVMVSKVADQPDGKTTKIDFGGIFYENLPAGELYAKYERKNYLTNANTCTYEVRSGYKRWF